ncbi:alanyl-tRNA editing protein [Siculibacillus lacustris]|uniref:Alanyl-tRNA editing protein n=1 Tax=Siculibacillus lacustris TaxID=1549641 RepID=A0A4Q9VGL6_9HYPH|nr:alanyl-tRNA editing protein [Siculibacillus lacustris]TBW33641.1 alanyl-tRNA editing protein [Siculibacillus lacustris]
MIRPPYFDDPAPFALDAHVVERRPGAVRLDRSPFFPGGGGQLADRGSLTWAGGTVAVTGMVPDPRGPWHLYDGDEDLAPDGTLRAAIDPEFRRTMCELHTLAHVLNALVHARFDGALLTGAQLGADRTFRLDFDVPGVDPDALRALQDPLDEVIRADLPIRSFFMPYDEAAAIPGLFRSAAVAPPPGDDGMVRIVEIVGLDRQACGGTHLASTGAAPPARIVKVDNKGRRNRRIKVALGPA